MDHLPRQPCEEDIDEDKQHVQRDCLSLKRDNAEKIFKQCVLRL